ncbi:glycosyltransferase family 2 protein [Candidatus Peregrinibacteria bacterium]|nr:glycosyltransferase family 2 protein [Candidatus Peregrinibacteria bacterium]
MQISVIIPTYNRPDILKECLTRLINQNFVKTEYEIIVVNDGGNDEAHKIVTNLAKNSPVQIRYFYQKNSGQGSARNRGLDNASGNLVLLINDDILATSNLLSEHVKAHKQHYHENEAVLGLILMDPRIEKTPFIEFMTNASLIFNRFGGHLTAYEKLKGRDTADYNFFYANISFKKSLLIDVRFDETFQKYGWEDIEFGYRLTIEKGLKIYYNPAALAYHYHPMDEESLRPRMNLIGASVHAIHAKYPELGKRPGLIKRTIFKLLGSKPVISAFDILRKRGNRKWHYYYFYALSKKYFLEGLRHEGLRGQAGSVADGLSKNF